MAKKKIDSGNLPTIVETGNNPLAYKKEFDTICGIISAHKKRAMYAVHNESLRMLWEVGAYVSDRLKKAIWGDGVVRMLAEYIHTRSPKSKGWSYRTIYKMVQFYETYSSKSFNEMVNHYGMQHYPSKSDQRELPDEKRTIVPFEMAQIPSVLFSTGWTNHQIIGGIGSGRTSLEREPEHRYYSLQRC